MFRFRVCRVGIYKVYKVYRADGVYRVYKGFRV